MYVDLPSRHFLTGFITKSLYAFHFSFMFAKFFAFLILQTS
jgi:hypothetical protein